MDGDGPTAAEAKRRERELEAITARRRVDRVVAAIAGERRIGPALAEQLSEAEVLEEATARISPRSNSRRTRADGVRLTRHAGIDVSPAVRKIVDGHTFGIDESDDMADRDMALYGPPPRPARPWMKEQSVRLWIMSDLHQQDLDRAWAPSARPEFDVLVVAGDVVEGDLSAGVEWIAAMADGRPSVLAPGNHEFWGRTIEDELDRARPRARDAGVALLEDQGWVEVGGVYFAGGVLWTDRRLNQPIGRRAGGTLAGEPVDVRGRDRPRRALADDLLRLHEKAAAALEKALGEPPTDGGPRVVVTHYAPSIHSIDPAWRHHGSAAFSASDLEHLLDPVAVDLWIHGHVHHSLDYVSYLGLRILCNPYGQGGSNPRFREDLVVEAALSGSRVGAQGERFA